MLYWYDFLILVILLFVSTIIGIYFGYFGKKPMTIKRYFRGGRGVTAVPIGVSVTVGHFSAILLLGVPSDVYKFGAFHVLDAFATVIYALLSIYIFYPKFFEMQVSNTFEYLEKRFDYKIRVLACILYLIYENLILPIVIYSPSLAVSVVSETNVHLISSIICIICIFYTAIGGLRTVIWTDLLQFTMIFISVLILCGLGINSAGGFTAVWNTSLKGGRLDIFDFDPDPTKKDSFWLLVIGSATNQIFYFTLSQSSAQKFLAAPSQRSCYRALLMFGLFYMLIKLLNIFFGLVLYAIYADCDPVLNKQITKTDQIAAYYTEQVARFVPGILGVFMTALICSGISSLSSSLNAVASLVYSDFIEKYIDVDKSEKFKVKILKIIIIVEGLICSGFVVVVPYLGDILPVVIGTAGIIDGPVTGLFILGVLFPKVGSNAAFFAVLGSLSVMVSIYVPSRFYLYNNSIKYPTKPLSTKGCFSVNSTSANLISSIISNKTNEINTNPQPFYMFRISYHYYSLIGIIAALFLGLVYHYVETKICEFHSKKLQRKPDERELESFLNLPTS